MSPGTLTRWLSKADPEQRARVKAALHDAEEYWRSIRLPGGGRISERQIATAAGVACEVAVIAETWRERRGEVA